MFLQEMDLILADFEPVDVGVVVSAALEGEREFAQVSEVSLDTNIAPSLPIIPGNAKRFERAFNPITCKKSRQFFFALSNMKAACLVL